MKTGKKEGGIDVNIGRKTLRNVFLGAAGCIVLYWLLFDTERVRAVLSFIKSVLAPFAVGAIIAFILNVPMRAIESRLKWIKKQGLRRGVALLLTFIAIVLVLFLIVQLLMPQVITTGEKLITESQGFYETSLAKVKELLREYPEAVKWLEENADLNQSGVVEKLVNFLGNSASNILFGTFSAVASLSSGIFKGVIAFVFGLYCLCRKEILARQARRLIYSFLPERICDETIRILRLTASTFSNFISGQCLEACILGCMFAVCMLIFRMPYVPLISVLVAVTALVPVIGAFVGCILGALFILVDGDPMKAVWFVVMFLAIQQFEANVIYPKVVGKSVGLPGMWVLAAVTIGGSLVGVFGMFIMIPLFSVIYTLLREITAKRVEKRGIPKVKLQDHPPELRIRLQGSKKEKKRKILFWRKEKTSEQAETPKKK